MKFIFSAMLLVFSGKQFPAAAQLKWITPYNEADSIVAINLLHAGDAHYTASRYDSAFYYYDQMERFSLQKKFYRGYMEALYGKENAYYQQQDYQNAEHWSNIAIAEAKRMNDAFLYAYGLGQLARIRMRTDRLDEAIVYYNNAIATYFSKVPTEEGSEIYGDLAYTYGLKGNYGKEIEYRIKSIEIMEKYFPQNDRYLSAKYHNLAAAYFRDNSNEKAISYFKKAAVIREKYKQLAGLASTYGNLSKAYLQTNAGESKRYLDLCEQYAFQSKEQRWIIYYHNRAMDFYQSTGEPQKAMEHQLKAIEILEKINKDPAELGKAYLNAAVLSGKNGVDEEVTKQYFSKSETLIRQAATNQKTNLSDYYRESSKFHFEKGNYKEAYDKYRSHILYKDSLTNDKVKKDFTEITTRYETAKKDNEIAKLNTEHRIKELQIEKQNAVIAGNRAEAERKQKEIDLLANEQELQDIKLQQQQEELERQQLLVKTNEQQLQLAHQQKQFADKEIIAQKKLVAAQTQLRNFIIAAVVLLLLLGWILFNRFQLKKKIEQQNALLSVRNNIAKDLHDEIGSTLTSIKILSEVSRANLLNDSRKAAHFIDKITEESEAMQQGMSDIVWAVSPDNDKLGNMLVRMREYINHTLEPKGVTAVFNIDENVAAKAINMQQRKDFFLVFKEIINNTAKHANASEVIIDISEQNGDIRMRITDNGQGFDTQKITSSNGLKNIKARIEALGGTYAISSEPAKGSSVTIRVPAT